MTFASRHQGASHSPTPLPSGQSLAAQPRPPANNRILVQDAVPASCALLLAWFLHFIAALAGQRRTALPQLLRARLASARSWHAQSWPAPIDANTDADTNAEAAFDPRVLARLLYVLGPPPCRGMRPHTPAMRVTRRRFTGTRDRRPAAA